MKKVSIISIVVFLFSLMANMFCFTSVKAATDPNLMYDSLGRPLKTNTMYYLAYAANEQNAFVSSGKFIKSNGVNKGIPIKFHLIDYPNYETEIHSDDRLYIEMDGKYFYSNGGQYVKLGNYNDKKPFKINAKTLASGYTKENGYFNMITDEEWIIGANNPLKQMEVVWVYTRHDAPSVGIIDGLIDAVTDSGTRRFKQSECKEHLSKFETFRVTPVITDESFVQTSMKVNGRQFVRANYPSGDINATATNEHVSNLIELRAVERNSDKVCVYFPMTNAYLSYDSTGKAICNSNLGMRELWTLVNLGNGKFALKNKDGKYLSAESGRGRTLIANKTRIGQWETFESDTEFLFNDWLSQFYPGMN
ncbi:fascin domain-containing protein [Clostridium sp. ZS2-4]|uniref:fascin domain-containing protein n=1 Tax=Clostridium sp. ZS2-4 TaxID=2987703 RepID=UPI00227AD017|nr:hypothetical protein [Clostridium sp. ZS2-4]MCY6354231.1 hypothetical protein [Clostridium sp. ZS2-4]